MTVRHAVTRVQRAARRGSKGVLGQEVDAILPFCGAGEREPLLGDDLPQMLSNVTTHHVEKMDKRKLWQEL